MPLPIINISQMREWEKQTWDSGRAEDAVMRRAGEAVAQTAREMTRPGAKILVLAGKGNNGGDARFAAESLTDRLPRLLLVSDPEKAHQELVAELSPRPDLVIDGLFGIGLNRPLNEHWSRLVRQINAARLPVLAVDAPSGLNADTGEPMGEAVRATVTVTFGAAKVGFLHTHASEFVGRLVVAPDIGLVPCPFQTELNWTMPSDFTGFPPRRMIATHKGSHGHLVIFAGSLGYHGAAVLAARAAQRAQPGLITVFTPEASYHPVASQLQAVMVSPWRPDTPLPPSTTAILFGPGLAANNLPEEIKLVTKRLWKDSPLPVIADASGLDWLPVEHLCPKGAIRVITPHPGEAARLTRTTAAEVQADRPAALRALSRRISQCHVVLKGHQTLCGGDEGPIYANPSGNPHLAQGGSGDVLSGYLGGLLAQPVLAEDFLTTIRYAVWQHGAAADALNKRQPNWQIEDLVAEIGNCLPGMP